MADDVHLFDPDPGSLFADVTWEACTHPDEVRLAAPQLVNVDDPGGLLTPPDDDIAAELARADLFGDDGDAWPWWCHRCGGAVTFSPIDDRDGAMTAEGPIHHACAEDDPPDDDGHHWAEHDAAVFDASRPFLCTCGHLRQNHANAYPRVRYASPCAAPGCTCTHYTHDPDPDPDEHHERAAAIRARLTARTTPRTPDADELDDDDPDDELEDLDDADELAPVDPHRTPRTDPVGTLDLLAPLTEGLCQYGTPAAGQPRPCNEPATHAARWSIRRHRDDTRPGPWSGGLDCCREHADYYATAWTPTYPAEWGAGWIDVLPHRHDADERLMPAEPDYHGTGYHGPVCAH